MAKGAYYVYALKDPRNSHAAPFYIGKGTGVRAWEHELKPDGSSKGKRISEIKNVGLDVVVSTLADGLSESQALKLEAELISAFGTEATGGLLTNAVIPSGMSTRVVKDIVVPYGAIEKAQMALQMLKDSVLELAKANKFGVTNSEVSKSLGLQSDYLGGSKDYLAWSILGLLMREGKMKRVAKKRHQAQVR
jgi:hypothetical protein